MTRVTIVTKLRFIAAIAPVILLVAAAFIALGFYDFGAMPTVLHDREYAAMRAAEGMEIALYKMDWGHTQPDGLQIVKDQQRRFVTWIDTARVHADTQAQMDLIEKIAQTANPIFDAMRAAEPGDDSYESRFRDLQALVADLISADDAAMSQFAAVAASRARVMIGVTIIFAILIPWVCFILVARMCGGVGAAMREIRARVERISERGAGVTAENIAGDLSVIDEQLSSLGYPRPNPMLAE